MNSMQTNVIDIIIYLVRRIQDGDELESVKLGPLKQYDRSEISAAYSWVVQQYEKGDLKQMISHRSRAEHSHRVLHMAERMMISREAYGYLLELHNVGLLDHSSMERIIEKAMFTGTDTLTIDRVKELATKTIFSDTPDSPFHTLYLKGNETIN